MKNLTSLTALALLLPALMVGCTQEQPENEKALEGKTGGTNELVIANANADANALPSQEEDFSEETKAKLKKLREEAAILKAETELNNQKVEANTTAAIVSGTPASATLFTGKPRSISVANEGNENYIPIGLEDFTNRAKGVLYDHPKLQQALTEKFVVIAGQDKAMDEQEAKLFQENANELLQKAGYSEDKTKKFVNFIFGNGTN
ncbi:MAG TPA: hypothetical protein PL131_11230 [Methylotenera sp.]|nr:hypothetical protein [Methylotenera sp.]HPH06439.1 hypothetical protein [Methylotenera sp.]HPN00414.1 hypothetical protein [Methylotenera sp.]